MVPGCQTDDRTASPVLAAAVKGRTWRLAGGGDAVCSWTPAVSASHVSPFRVSGRWCPPFPRCWQCPPPRASAKDRNVRVGPQSLSRRHPPSCLPLETRPTRAGGTNQTNRDSAGTLPLPHVLSIAAAPSARNSGQRTLTQWMRMHGWRNRCRASARPTTAARRCAPAKQPGRWAGGSTPASSGSGLG
jgi:hypothetical protein